jgi:hypothetical protein
MCCDVERAEAGARAEVGGRAERSGLEDGAHTML